MNSSKYPTISVCATVNTEEKRIDEFITSLLDFADEIVISDTGSLDRTPQIIQSYIDKGITKLHLHHYKSPGDFHFGLAKNFVMSKCSMDYILVLDADERLSEGFKSNIRSFLLQNKPEVVTIVRCDDFLSGFEEVIERMVRRGNGVMHGIDLDSRVHEHLMHNFKSYVFPYPVWHCQREKHWLLRPHSRFYYLGIEIDRTPKTKSFFGHLLRGLWKFQYKFKKIYFHKKMRLENEGLRYALFRALYDLMIEFFVGLKRENYIYWETPEYKKRMIEKQTTNLK